MKHLCVFLKCLSVCHPGPSSELQRLTETQWSWRYNGCKSVRDRLPAIVLLLKEISEERNGDRAVEAWGLLDQIHLKIVGFLVFLVR